jgi:hypothetical protein
VFGVITAKSDMAQITYLDKRQLVTLLSAITQRAKAQDAITAMLARSMFSRGQMEQSGHYQNKPIT